MFFIRLNSTLVITSHTLKNVEKTHYDTIRVCYGELYDYTNCMS